MEVTFKNSKGLVISGSLDLPTSKGPFPGVLALHGFGGSKESNEEWGEILNPLGIAVLRIDFSGSGKSEGLFEDKTISGFIDDATSGINYLYSNQLIGKDKIGIVGHSAGAFIAMLVASKDKRITALITSVPGVNEGDIIANLYDQNDFSTIKDKGYVELMKSGEKKKLKLSFFEDIKKYNLIEEANKIPYKFLLIGAKKDSIVPWNEILEIKDKINNAKLLELENSDHDLEKDWNIAERGIREWFSKWLVN